MKRIFLPVVGLTALALASLPIAGCKKSESPSAEAAASSGAPSVAAPAKPAKPPVDDYAAKLGFAQHLPASTEMYVGSANLKAHLEAAKKSSFWKDVAGFIDDKVPAPSAGGDKQGEAFKKLWGDDAFIAVSKGGSPAFRSLRDLMEVYNEINYHAIMAGGPLASMGGGAGSQPEKMMQALMGNPDLLKRAAAAIGALQLPPLVIGTKADKADEIIATLLTEEFLTGAKEKMKAKIADITTSLGGKFKTFDVKLSDVITDEMKTQMIGGLPLPDDVKATVTKAVDDLRAKTIAFAIGTVGGNAVFALGHDLKHLEFTDKPADSLLAKPDLDFIAPYAAKNPMLLMTVDKSLFEAAASSQPFQPIVRGLISGLKSSEMFAGLAKKLEAKIPALAAAEAQLYAYKHDGAAAIGWWEGGFRFESRGGSDLGYLDCSKPLQFAPLLDDPSVVLGFNYNGDASYAAHARAYGELWIDILYTGTGELVRSGLAGEQGAATFEMIDKQIIPHLVSFYKASKEMDEKGLGTEHAILVDVGGKLSGVPGVPPAMADEKMIRVAGVHQVVSRPLIGDSWTKMDAALKAMIAAIPSPTPIPVPAPMSSEKNGITTWFYPLPFMTDDLTICASVNDRLFMSGTSKTFNEAIAGALSSAKPGAEKEGLRYKLSFGNVRTIVKTAAAFGAMSQGPAAAEEVKAATKWIAPFENLTGRAWQENGRNRGSMTWEIHDVVKFD